MTICLTSIGGKKNPVAIAPGSDPLRIPYFPYTTSDSLRIPLSALGFRYRLNVKGLPGKPDIVLAKYKLAIFVDGDFWHGYNWKAKKPRIKSNADYWIRKIEGNIARDKVNNRKLKNKGFTVLRFWNMLFGEMSTSVFVKFLRQLK